MKAFSLRDSTLALPQANLKTRTSLTSLQRPYSIPSNYATHQTIDARKTVATSNYSDTRPFLVHGKSEKSLSAPNRPMTIDEVRELLNKNK